ncbi:ATP cone domain-containing protein [Pareuzebyella sediminis]|uniref:ATP cone domain-containing protein n=1 Tax=Pareuzebyella sediminis TaxID=2607998 RepID=UPI001E438FB4|nr:ATP cone domain-containing protein [Pareuzebyella sediminis]
MDIVKSTGTTTKFSIDKLRASLRHSGADEKLIQHIVDVVRDELYQGISTREIYNRAFAILKKKKATFASKYKLKRAIYELGPTGFPFEKFVAAILNYSGYHTEVGKIMPGVCVSHEIDVFAEKDGHISIIECKFHGEEGRKCDVKIPLYIHSRYQDVKQEWEAKKNTSKKIGAGVVVTNTRFTTDATNYGNCMGLEMLSWDFPEENGLKDRIDRLALYPITVLQVLSSEEKQFLLGRGIVLCRQLLKNGFYLDHLGISDSRKEKIMKETRNLCTNSFNDEQG